MDWEVAEKILGALFVEMLERSQLGITRDLRKDNNSLVLRISLVDKRRDKGNMDIRLIYNSGNRWSYLLVVEGETFQKFEAGMKRWLDEKLAELHGEGLCI